MGLRINMTHDVLMACDHLGCAESYQQTWVEEVASALTTATQEGWHIGMSSTSKGSDLGPTLTYCPAHTPTETPDALPAARTGETTSE